ncbi:Transposase and inactivated derivatives [Listeria grayi]|uniref:Transposase n=1 Tax=Listeria grayi FSL F6-1183 TaxID=1265827 RepID=A0A829R7U2_LISGR|nr:helix-turn-helix domain-containing protein [Listeria grayi]EUJ27799.1 transposase [Listeria grayi FSL F6-1183]VEI34728.1 Transposase and inactivated derivatives [Listeria grayi]
MTMNRTDFDTRVFLVNEIIRNGKTVTTVAKENNLNRGTLSDWVRKYKKSGPESLKPYRKKYSYTYQEKIAAVKRVILNGKSILGTVEEFNISSKAVLKAWIKNYNRQKELKNTGSRLSTMKSKKSSKKTSIQERLEIVQYTIAHNYNYQAAIKKYGVSYQQIYTWIRKYNSKGIQGLQDKRGRNQIIEELSEIDKLKLENNKLRDRNEFLEMEIDIEKKLQELNRNKKLFH